ncbi:uncharacterized protein LOC115664763 isoform X2 [Syzygium oleosum]|uniref:uncharacterized protein LOC115664763 isoform X2 n=1 Tax=Syzygium oleosum TaxID=219896 RepID=UPI0024B99765|nr:uncharacterized protein LOC115664763 isoform X2 [Syzygium oleosum]
MSSATLEIKLSRPSRIYRPSEPLEGKIVVKSASSISHRGVRLAVNGSVNMQVRGGTAGLIESIVGAVKPVVIVNRIIEVTPSGRIAPGTTEIPFSVTLKQSGDDTRERFYETFHGANINIQGMKFWIIIVPCSSWPESPLRHNVSVQINVTRGYLHKSLCTTMEFILETDKAELLDQPASPEMVIFYITQDTQRHPLLPELKSGGFRVTGKFSVQCALPDPISGELIVETSAVPIHSVDIHILRIESILFGDRIVTETSLVQTTQIADGDVSRRMMLPIYVILPRLLTCPTTLAGPFSIEFKVAIVITFQSELLKMQAKSDPRTPRLWMAMETLPLELVRTR